MINHAFAYAALCGAVGILLAGAPVSHANGADGATTVSSLAKETHFHGIAVDQRDRSRLYLATHHGFYAVTPDGTAVLISETRDDFMGFTAHPSDPAKLFASGHPHSGGNLGFLASRDGGKSWIKLSDGFGGPVDFHQMDISKADPMVIYGIYRVLQRSDDGGRSWKRVGPPPDGLIDVAASSLNADTLYAATQHGLVRSADGGKSWDIAHTLRRPATMVHVTPAGDIYAFIVGTGLVHATERELQWRVLSQGFRDEYVLHFTIDPTDRRQLYAIAFNPGTKLQTVRASHDGGATWRRLQGDRP